MTPQLADRVRRHLAKHPSVAYRPTELAHELREDDVDQVTSTLRALRDSHEAVSCWVTRGDVHDEEFRITAGVLRAFGSPLAPARNVPAPVPTRCTRGEGAMWHGPSPLRRNAIVDFITATGRPVFPSELIAHARTSHPETREEAIYCAINVALKRGVLVRLAKQTNPDTGRAGFRYDTPGRTARNQTEFSQGSGGEAGNGKAGRKPAAPRGDEATRPSAEKTAPNGAGVRAGPAFGLLPDGSLAIRGAETSIDLAPRLTRELFAWLDGRAGSGLVKALLP